MTIYIDTDSFPANARLYADAEKTKALPRIIPAVQLTEGSLQIGFLGDYTPYDGSTLSLAASIQGTQTQVLASNGSPVDGASVPTWEFVFALNSAELAEAIEKRGNATLSFGVIATATGYRQEWQFLSVCTPTATSELNPEQVESAKDYAEQARQSAQDAEQSKQAAATSAANAANSASAAAQSKTASANSATSAATSASNAANSATKAADSAEEAADSAEEAATSANNASASASVAKTSATNAKASETAAATSATNAATSATNAKTSETNAATSATAAAESAEGAESTLDTFRDEKGALEANVASNTERIEALEGIVPYAYLGLGWFKPNNSAEADATVGRLDDKRRILIGIDKAGKISNLTYGSYGADGLWHDNTEVYAGIYVKRYDHDNKIWKTPIPAPHATGKTYSENTLDRRGIMPWAGFRNVVIENELNGVECNNHAVKVPKFYICKKYNVSIWFEGASSAEVGELKIILEKPPAENFVIGTEAGSVTIAPEDFIVHDAFIVPAEPVADDDGNLTYSTREVDFVCLGKYWAQHKNCAGTNVTISQPTASSNAEHDRATGINYTESANAGTMGADYVAVSNTAAIHQMIVDLFDVEFATRSCQSVNTGAGTYDTMTGVTGKADVGLGRVSDPWILNNAENLDDFSRRGSEDIPATGWVDYFGKQMTEHNRSLDASAAEVQSTGQEYLTRIIYRGICSDVFCGRNIFISDIQHVFFAAREEIPTANMGADYIADLVANGYAVEDAETGIVTAGTSGCLLVAARNPSTPFSEIYRSLISTAAARTAFVASYIDTGKYFWAPVLTPLTNRALEYYEDVPGAMEFPSAVEVDGRVNGVDRAYSAASLAMRASYAGGSCGGSTSIYGLRDVGCDISAYNASWAFGSRVCYYKK